MKEDFPFFMKFLICFFLFDSLEKGWTIFQIGIFPIQRLFEPTLLLLIIVGLFDLLIVVQFFLKFTLLRLWLPFFMIMNLTYQAFYFIQLSPIEWSSLSPQDRWLQVFTTTFYFTVIMYSQSEEAKKVLTE